MRQVVCTDGDSWLGGDDVDCAIAEWIQQQHAVRGEDWCCVSRTQQLQRSYPRFLDSLSQSFMWQHSTHNAHTCKRRVSDRSSRPSQMPMSQSVSI